MGSLPRRDHRMGAAVRAAAWLLLPLACAPAVIALATGTWTEAGAWQLHAACQLLLRLTSPLLGNPLQGSSLVVVLVTAAVWVMVHLISRHARRLPRPLSRFGAVVQWIAALWALALIPWAFALALATDPWLLLGALIAGWAVGTGATVEPQHDRRPAVTATTVALSVGVVLAAGAIMELGSDPDSPLLALRSPWLAGPARSAWLSGGIWLGAAGLVVGLQRERAVALARATPTWRWAVVAAVALGAALLQGWLAHAPHLIVARGLSAAGVLLLATFATPWLRAALSGPMIPRIPLDPRRAVAALAPALLLAVVCALRTLSVQMWTVPPTLPAGVEQLDPRRGTFSLVVSPSSGEVIYTVREENRVGVLTPGDGEHRSWSPRDAWTRSTAPRHSDPDSWSVQDKVEVVRGPAAGSAWVNVDKDELGLGLMPVGDAWPPTRYVPLGECSVTAWLPVPPGAVAAIGAAPGDLLVGCEQQSSLPVFRPGEERVVAQVPLGSGLEAGAFSPDGTELYGVMLLGHPNLRAFHWPSGRVLRERRVGPFNWTLALDPRRDTLWLGRFLEGGAILLDARTFEVRGQVRLSFGVRDLIYEPVHDRIWAAAAYSGLVWSVDAAPPHARTSYALCGEARSLAADSEGRVVVGTDCGIYRIDPTSAATDRPRQHDPTTAQDLPGGEQPGS